MKKFLSKAKASSMDIFTFKKARNVRNTGETKAVFCLYWIKHRGVPSRAGFGGVMRDAFGNWI